MVSRLEIVNHMLAAIGENAKKFTSLETQHPSVVQALSILDSTDSDFQGRGWWFNTEYESVLSADDTGKITLAPEIWSVQPISSPAMQQQKSNSQQFVIRARKMYDTYRHTFIIGAPITANVVIRLEIEDLPHLAGVYLKHKAAEAMFLDDDGDAQKLAKLEGRTAEAWHYLKAEELRVANVNALNSPSAQQLRYRSAQNNSAQNPHWPGG